MKAILVDDEELARYELRRLLKAHPQVEIVGEAGDGPAALELIREQKPELLFLDIQMPGMSGFELLEKIDGGIPGVIFTTAFDQHAIRAFEVNALDYLLKPVSPRRLAEAVLRWSERPGKSLPAQIFVRDGEQCWIVRVNEIVLMESEGNYTRLHFHGVRPLVRRSLNSLEAQLDPQFFFRANRRQIVNLGWVETTHLQVSGGLMVRLRNGIEIELSRRQSDELRARLSF